VEVPAVIPVTTPVEEPMVAFALLLLQVPPVVVLLRVMVRPAHTSVGPVMVASKGLTVTVVIAMQPVPRV
jgi:hypothetical protein